uniref:Steroid nuclear receptor ligand-binding n=1 Tax=Cucumis melo TaxID=3656 RepID=A0A9I9D8V0_CUCME
MQDLRQRTPPNGEHYEIRLLHLPGALIAGVLGIVVDVFMISFIAIFKSPIMLFKGWHRLFNDLIGREGPFLETICVPFAGLIILLWPLAVVGSVLGSIASSLLLGAYAGIVAYQESSILLGLRYIVASLSIYDEYSNDVLDMPEGSCFPRLTYRRVDGQSLSAGLHTSASSSRPSSFRDPPSRMNSLKEPMIDLKPLELLDSLFKACQHHGETMVCEGIITSTDIEDAKSSKGSQVISIGLPAFCILEALLRSAKANSAGLLLSDNVEISSTNRPKDTFFDWFFNPLLIIKDQIKAENLSESEEEYLYRLVLLSGDPERLKNSTTVMPPQSERRQAELEAIARRLEFKFQLDTENLYMLLMYYLTQF